MFLFLFLILLSSCWVVAASRVAEHANAGVAVFVADTTSMCGFGSDGATARLSACSLVRCCSHQFLFPCLEVLPQSTPPLCAISCKALPGHSVDVDSLHISYAEIFISQVRAAGGSPPQCQLTRLILIIIKNSSIYFIQIRHTDDFPSTGTRLVSGISRGVFWLPGNPPPLAMIFLN